MKKILTFISSIAMSFSSVADDQYSQSSLMKQKMETCRQVGRVFGEVANKRLSGVDAKKLFDSPLNPTKVVILNFVISHPGADPRYATYYGYGWCMGSAEKIELGV